MSHDKILNLDEKDQIVGEIYKIVNKINQKCYIGQTQSHRLNKNKYRPYGSIGRFNSHVSEAVNNTKRGCTYLNNALKKYGKDNFDVIILENCSVDTLNEREIYYINHLSSLFPNGYNLTKGGQSIEFRPNVFAPKREPFKKRGREFGYAHKDSTKQKMSDRLKIIKSTDSTKELMKVTMNKFYDEKKIDILKEYDLSDDVEDYIKPVKKKDTDDIHDYVIKIEGRKLTLRTNDESLDYKYERLKNILLEAKNLQGKNC